MTWHLLKQPWADAIILSRGAKSECAASYTMPGQTAPIAAVIAVIYRVFLTRPQSWQELVETLLPKRRWVEGRPRNADHCRAGAWLST